jgi:hypothetical protein
MIFSRICVMTELSLRGQRCARAGEAISKK